MAANMTRVAVYTLLFKRITVIFWIIITI